MKLENLIQDIDDKEEFMDNFCLFDFCKTLGLH